MLGERARAGAPGSYPTSAVTKSRAGWSLTAVMLIMTLSLAGAWPSSNV